MIVLSSEIPVGNTGDYNTGYQEGDVLYDPAGNPYFFDGENWWDGEDNNWGPTPDPSWTQEEP